MSRVSLQDTITSPSTGIAAPSATVTIRVNNGEGALATVYTASTGATQANNPITQGDTGFGTDGFLNVWLEPGLYSIEVDTGGVTREYSLPAVPSDLSKPLATIAEMTAVAKVTISDGAQATVSGSGGGSFVWDATSTATADGSSVIASDEGGAGRWLRFVANIASQSGVTVDGDIVLLVTGQSNALGGAATGSADTTTNANVLAWDNTGSQWVTATIGAAPFDISVNNFGFHAAKHLQEATGKRVRIILVAQGGQPIARWLSDDATPTLWTRITTEVPAALAAAGLSRVDRVMWHQGETDNGRGCILYRNDLIAVKDQMKAQAWWQNGHTYMLAGEMVQSYLNANQNQILGVRLAAELDGEIAVVPSLDLPANAGDEIHFTSQGLVDYGKRYGIAALKAYADWTVTGSRNATSDAIFSILADGSGDFTTLQDAVAFLSSIKFQNGKRAVVALGAGQWTLAGGLRCDGLKHCEFTGVLAGGFVAPVKADFTGTSATDLAMLRGKYLTEIVCDSHGLIANGGRGGAWRDMLVSSETSATNNYAFRTDDPNLLRDEQGGTFWLENVAIFGFDASGAGGLRSISSGSIQAVLCVIAHCDRALLATTGSKIQANNIVMAHTGTQEVFASGAAIDVSVFGAKVESPTGTVYQAVDYAVINARTADSNTSIAEVRGGVVNNA